MDIRIGHGFDLHQLLEGLPFKLGGEFIPFSKGALGHSDGDTLLHALTDALLGATGESDIGEWFPPNDPQYKDADSQTLLKSVWHQLQQKGWVVLNLDATILLEKPVLKSFKPIIKNRLADLLEIQSERVSVKAKTMEGLGPIGQQEAVAAWVTVLVQRQTSDFESK